MTSINDRMSGQNEHVSIRLLRNRFHVMINALNRHFWS